MNTNTPLSIYSDNNINKEPDSNFWNLLFNRINLGKTKKSDENNIASALFGESVTPNDLTSIDASIIDLGLDETYLDGGLTLKGKLKEAKAKANKFLSAKTVNLTKHLDSYGVIDNISKTKENDIYEIYARIYDMDDDEFIDEISFLSSEFSLSDRKRINENAVFYWHVGVEKNIFGQEKHVSEFRLRRIATR